MFTVFSIHCSKLKIGIFAIIISHSAYAHSFVEVETKQSSGAVQKWNISCGGGESNESNAEGSIELLKTMGVDFIWDSSCNKVTLQGQSPAGTEREATTETREWTVVSTHKVELNGNLSSTLNIQAPAVSIETSWSSPELNVSPHPFHLDDKKTDFIVSQGAILRVNHLSLSDLDFHNQGSIIAEVIELGEFYTPVSSFENTSTGVLKANRIMGEFRKFLNKGRLESLEKLDLRGDQLDNRAGTLVSDQELYIDFFELQNQNGKIKGSKNSTVHIAETLENAFGSIESDGPTELNFSAQSSAPSLGDVRGSEILLTLRHSSPVELQSGNLWGKESISVFSNFRVSLPGVQFHTPLLNLAAPDFALDPVTECGTPMVHCDPKRNFCLSSSLSSQGEIRFLESDYCRYPPTEQKINSENQALSTLDALSLKPQLVIEKQMNQLGEAIKDLEVHFEKDRGYLSKYTVSIDSQLSSMGKSSERMPRVFKFTHRTFLQIKVTRKSHLRW